MDLPPDPYLALGLPKDATQAAVKTAHRKLVLKCHPDKVTDPDAKQAAADQFHKIQTAYEILIDEDRRGRYDAQVRLAGLRKEAMESRSGGGAARSSHKSSHEAPVRPAYASRASERMAPQYEERRPSYAADYFDVKPRSSPARKEAEYERPSSKRSEPKEKVRTSARDVKESERERRKEKTRKTDRETRKERETKYNPYIVDESDSESDEHARRSRRMRDEEIAMRKAREAQYEDSYRHRKESAAEAHDTVSRKWHDAHDYIQSSRTRPRAEPMEDARPRPRMDPREETERRPSAARMSSTKDKVEYVKGRDGRPSVVVRRTSERPKSKDVEPPRAEYSSRREPERRSSAEKLAERRPPMLNTSKSSPSDIRILGGDKQRSQSVQVDAEHQPRVSPIKRAETMPYGIPRVADNTVPAKSSNLRQTEFPEGLATPATTPDNATPPSNKFNYGRTYADDGEYPTPDGYVRTEVREPSAKSRPTVAHRVTRSPSPIKEAREAREQPREREERPRDLHTRDGRSARTSSARYPSSPQPAMPARTTSYMYSGPERGVEAYERPRPTMSRGESLRTDIPTRETLYGEVPTTRSPLTGSRHRSAAGDEGIRYAKAPRPEDIKVQSGYSSMGRRAERPMYTRSGSGYSGVKA